MIVHPTSGPTRFKGKILRTKLDGWGYKEVSLSAFGKGKTVKVHRLVALAFLGNPFGLTMNHISGIKTDNSPGNIEYVTQSENNLHAYRAGLQRSPKGEQNGRSKLTESQVREIIDLGNTLTQKEIALRFGTTSQLISGILSGKK